MINFKFAFVSVSLLALNINELNAAKAKRPNILIAIADDATWFSWKQYHNENSKYINTPAFDYIAKQGVVFTNCYTQNPKSAPSRASLLTGRNSWQLEEASMHCSVFPSKYDVYPDVLERNGYQVGFTGKGWAPGSWEKGGFKRNPAGPEFNQISYENVPSKGISKNNYPANFELFLNSKKENEPFCFWFGALEPHRDYEFGCGIRNGKRLEMANVLPFWPDNDIVRTDLLDYAFEIEWFDKQLMKMIKILEEKGELENTIIVVTADNGMSFPRAKGNVFDAGVHLPLAIMWMDKVKGGRTVDDFISFRDFAPTFVEVAGIKPVKGMTGNSFLTQLLSTRSGRICEKRNFCLLGREVHETFSYPVRAIKKDKWLYVKNYNTTIAGDEPLDIAFRNGYDKGWIVNYPTDIEVLREYENGKRNYYDLAVAPRESEQLYDMTTDPYCLINLANKREFFIIKNELIHKMEKELRKDKDPRILGNGAVFESYPFYTN